ncbi:hypothetical protein PT974_12072 [Cladobotryum mycophilum]|uniref:Uncharacterized protein n=1 Tax=Cladobotryum mycophilum TaxID=491253 RepID=A0ABR0S8G7_9HYPO
MPPFFEVDLTDEDITWRAKAYKIWIRSWQRKPVDNVTPTILDVFGDASDTWDTINKKLKARIAQMVQQEEDRMKEREVVEQQRRLRQSTERYNAYAQARNKITMSRKKTVKERNKARLREADSALSTI